MKSLKTFPLVLSLAYCTSPSDTPHTRLHDLFDREWESRLETSPLLATSVGRHEWNDRLPSVAASDHERRAEAARGFLEELEAIDSGQLDAQDQISYEIFERQLTGVMEEMEFREFEMPINADSGFHISFSWLPSRMPFTTPKDYENYISRLNACPAYFDQQVANMRAGLERGFTVPKVALEGYETAISAHVVDDPETSLFYEPFKKFPVGVAASEHARLRAAGREAIQLAVVPAYRKFLEFMLDEYIPGARETIGASELPRGREYYQQRIRHFTTLDQTAEEIHELGLREVARIRAEMEAVIKEVGFQGSFADFLRFLRTNPRFYAKTPEELLKQASYIAKRMDAKLPSLFKTLPRLPYGVAPVPDHIAPKYTGGRYVPPPKGSTEPGYYWVNTYALDSRPLYILEALTLHEAVPGHHLQGALAKELEGLPDFRQYSYLSAFGEGWGLYSEWLGVEAGFYTDPYSNFGRLTYEMWRACRLVVDTGMHALSWSRRQAMDYLASNTALSLHEVRTETDRYIAWPAQALAYKMGELKIKELRREAEQALGEQFDVREFHDAVLLNGSVPLPVLERTVRAWIETEQAGTTN